MTDHLDVLKRVDLFDGVDAATMQRLYESGRRVRVDPGQLVVRQGDYGDSFFVLLAGAATVELVGDDGRPREVAQVRPGEYFGELALIGRGERRASVRARGSVEVLELRKIHFDHTIKKNKVVRTRIERAYVRSAIDTFIRQSRYFRDLPAEAAGELVDTSTLATFSKNDVISREGDPAQSLFIVRTGFVRVSRLVHTGGDRESGEEILAYLGPEDFFGDEEVTVGAAYGATAVAVEPVECMVVPRTTVWSIYLRHPELFASFRRYSLARSEQQSHLLESKTSMGFVRDMLEAGLGQARSALIIRLDTCVRCGNCVQACDDLHGYSRMARRGKKMTRRQGAEDHRHEDLYFPTSCLQCAAPECMVGCPTGAISRDVGGEIYIKDTCIGCGNCARNCDFGNIAMAQVKEEVPSILAMLSDGEGKSRRALDRAPTALVSPIPIAHEKKSELIAVKCDVCFEREFAACVYNCPVEAVVRIDPRLYFEEIRQISPKAAVEGVPRGSKLSGQRSGRRVDAALQALAFTGTLGGGIALHDAIRPTSWTGPGLYAGVLGAVIMGLLALMGLRKRLRTQKLGSLFTWARVHSVLGAGLFGVVLFHAGYRAASTLTATLVALLGVSTLVGFGGQIASAWLPRILSRTEDEALLPEDVGPAVRALEEANEAFLADSDPRARARVLQMAKRLTGSGLSYVRRGVSPKKLPELLERRAKRLPPLSDHDHALAIRLAENMARIRMFGARRGLEILLTSWVPVHLTASAMAMMLLFGHLITVLLW